MKTDFFFNAAAKKLGDDLFKSRTVPACACCLHTIERFVCTCCEFFINAAARKLGRLCLNRGLSLHVPAVHTPQKVLFAHAASFFLRSAKKLGKLCLNRGLSLF